MHWPAIIRLCGILVMLYSLSFIPSAMVSLYYSDGEWIVFGWSFVIAVLSGLALWLPTARKHDDLSVRDGFLVVTLLWTILGVVGALPFTLGLHLNITDAVFESVSGFTTTGATVILGLDRLPPSILYHRQQLQWLGGMGIIVLAIAILPWLGVGGMQLYRAEASWVVKHDKLTPRIAETGRALWSIYVALTLVCAAAFWLAGMSLFDAIGHAFSTISTGGFSTHDESMAYFNSPLIETIAIVFMLAGGINFAIHFTAYKRLTVAAYVGDSETRAYGRIFLYSSLFVAASLFLANAYSGAWESVRYATFQVASILTSTGFTTATFSEWPLHVPLLLIILSFTGSCASSTAGGIKVIRIMLLAKLGVRQVAEDVLLSVLGFYVLYVVTSLLLTVAMMAAGLDLESAFGAVFSTINLLGPGMGEVANNFSTVGPAVKWLGVFGMLVGRLEVFTLLILFLPSFWRY
jgi:trk system potassium uptake protein TrkH